MQDFEDEMKATFMAIDDGNRSPEHISRLGELKTQPNAGAMPEPPRWTTQQDIPPLPYPLTPFAASPAAEDPSTARSLLDDAPEIDTGQLDELVSRSLKQQETPKKSRKPTHITQATVDDLESAAIPPTPASDLIISSKKFDSLIELINELVVNQSILAGHRASETLQSEQSVRALSYTEKLAREIQHIAMSLPMLPVSALFQEMRRTANDVAQSLGKAIQFVTVGEHVEIDKIALDKISNPLTHLVHNAVRNAINHGGEKNGPEEITLSALQREDRIVLTLAYNGRSVGMDAVQRAIEDLKEDIQIQINLGQGTIFSISLPLSMSILTGVVVGISERKYIIPATHLIEMIELGKYSADPSTTKGRMISLRGEAIPVYSLPDILHGKSPEAPGPVQTRSPAVITVHDGKKVSFEVDHIFGQQQFILKKLGSEMRELPGIMAGAILSDGEPGLVLNLNEFLDKGISHAA